MGMISGDTIGQIRRAYFEQDRSIKEIAHTLSVSRTTVRKVTATCKDWWIRANVYARLASGRPPVLQCGSLLPALLGPSAMCDMSPLCAAWRTSTAFAAGKVGALISNVYLNDLPVTLSRAQA